MHLASYIEINIVCLILSAIIYKRTRGSHSIHSTAQLTMLWLIGALWILCLSDVVAILSRGRFFPGAHVVVEWSNMIYICAMPVISQLWYHYVLHRLGMRLETKHSILLALPLIVFILICLTNPIHHFIFMVDEKNIYSRGPGIIIHWLISWFYLVMAMVEAFKATRSTTNRQKQAEYRPLLYFIILPIIGGVAQMILYGVTSVQVGITLSLILISMQSQDNQTTIDELTGLNNRRAMNRYVQNMVSRGTPVNLNVIMIDINRFKKINDSLGHAVGDMALIDAGHILTDAVGQIKEQLFMCRFGGDEFVVIGHNLGSDAIGETIASIRKGTDVFNSKEDKLYCIEFSIGVSSGMCEDYEDFMHQLRLADEAMYEEKKRLLNN